MRQFLKFLRTVPFVNLCVRVSARLLIDLSSSIERLGLRHWPVRGRIRFTLPGGERLCLLATRDEVIPTRIFWRGYAGYEGPSVKLLYNLSKGCDTIVDIGAHVGLFSMIAAASNPRARVYAFEPVGFIHERLRTHLRLNRLGNVVPERIAIGERCEPLTLYVPRGIEGSLPLESSANRGWAAHHARRRSAEASAAPKDPTGAGAEPGVHELTVPSMSLDAYKGENGVPPIDLVKIDCETHEVAVLEGMRAILEEDRPLILLEVFFPDTSHVPDEHLGEIERLLGERGYYHYLVTEDALIRTDRVEFNPAHDNHLFAPNRSSSVYLPYSAPDHLLRQVLAGSRPRSGGASQPLCA